MKAQQDSHTLPTNLHKHNGENTLVGGVFNTLIRPLDQLDRLSVKRQASKRGAKKN